MARPDEDDRINAPFSQTPVGIGRDLSGIEIARVGRDERDEPSVRRR